MAMMAATCNQKSHHATMYSGFMVSPNKRISTVPSFSEEAYPMRFSRGFLGRRVSIKFNQQYLLMLSYLRGTRSPIGSFELSSSA